jgi:hypothetical protein
VNGYEIQPEPEEAEREAIAAALATASAGDSEWAAAALLEGVDAADPEP